MVLDIDQRIPLFWKLILASIARNEQVFEVMQTHHGTKYVVDESCKNPIRVECSDTDGLDC